MNLKNNWPHTVTNVLIQALSKKKHTITIDSNLKRYDTSFHKRGWPALQTHKLFITVTFLILVKFQQF